MTYGVIIFIKSVRFIELKNPANYGRIFLFRNYIE